MNIGWGIIDIDIQPRINYTIFITNVIMEGIPSEKITADIRSRI